MDKYGKGWIDRTRLNLQTDMEAFLKKNPHVELNNHEFYRLAFQSHQKAYLDAGFLDLSGRDVVQFLDILDFVEAIIPFDYVNFMALKQTIALGNMYLDAHDGDSDWGKFKEMVVESGYLAEAWSGSLVDGLKDALQI